MAVRNKISQFIENHGITAYKLSKQTGLTLNTVYRLANNPDQIPSGDVIDAILNKYTESTINELIEQTREIKVVA